MQLASGSTVRRVFFLALIASTAGFAQAAGTTDGGIQDTHDHARAPDLSVMAYLPWYYGFGGGLDGRYELQVLPQGFVPTLNDSVSVEPSLGLAFTRWTPFGTTYSVFEITPAVYGLWSFHFSPQLRAYLGLGLGYSIGVGSTTKIGTYSASYFYWDPVLGISYNFAKAMAVRGELGAQGLKVGLSFDL